MCQDTVVLHGGIIHSLVHNQGSIITYNICTTEQGKIKLPVHISNFKGRLYLGSYYSHERRKLLKIFGVDGFMIYMWNQLPSGEWAPEAVMIDAEEKLRSLEPDIINGRLVLSNFQCSNEWISPVFLLIYQTVSSARCRRVVLTVLDLETKEIRMQEYSIPPPVLLEVDLPSRLQSMKIFSIARSKQPRWKRA
jgi:hypothetical protein